LKGHDYAKSPNYVTRASKIWELCLEAQQYGSGEKKKGSTNLKMGEKKEKHYLLHSIVTYSTNL
jgi:hypothetical protein